MPPQTAIIACSVLDAEVRALAPPNALLHFMPQGLHNTPHLLREHVQAAIDHIEQSTTVNTIILVYGLCSRGTEGLHTSRASLLLPRAHDCITLLLGSKQRYADYTRQHPGTYWYSPGWNKHHTPPGKERYEQALATYRAKFSEDDVDYLMQTEQSWRTTYSRAAFVDLALADAAPDRAYTQRCADWLGWTFDQQQGDPTLLRDLLHNVDDPERFLRLAPGQTLRLSPDDRTIVPITLNGQTLSH